MYFPFLGWLTLKPRTVAAVHLRWNLAAWAGQCQLAIENGWQSNGACSKQCTGIMPCAFAKRSSRSSLLPYFNEFAAVKTNGPPEETGRADR